ncbi:regulator of G-protein signaling [Acrasis kona]|uniref:Regulator of G-protein signaling n=1 Tax=Acrasis kona TaxID=1008807 RepID=A0AAW2YKI8_9EUKA
MFEMNFTTNTTNSTGIPTQLFDQPSSIYISYIFVVAYTIWTACTILLVVWRRNHQPLKARLPWIITFYLALSWVTVIVFSIRIVTGRPKFPCLVITAAYNIGMPLVFVPHILRCSRLFFIYRLCKLKTHINLFSRSSSGDAIDSDQDSTQMIITPTTPGTTIIPIVAVDEKEDVSLTRKSALIKVISKLISTPIMGTFTIIATFLQLCVWITSSGIISIYQPEYMSFKGCDLTTSGNVAIVIGIVYTLIDIMFVIMLFKVKDTWGIKYETLFVTIVWAALIILFAVLINIPVYNQEYDYYFPCFYILFIGFFIEGLVCGLLPALLSFKSSPSQEKQLENSNGLQSILDVDAYRAKFLTFCVRSFCPENLLCWEDIQKYNRTAHAESRAEFAELILNKFVRDGAPVQLNMPASFKQKIQEINSALESFKADKQPVPDNLLLPLENHCIRDLGDSFERFILTRAYTNIQKEIQIQKDQNVLLEETGLNEI